MDDIKWHFESRRRVFRLNFFLSGLTGVSILAWFFNTIPPKEGSAITIAIILITATLFCFLYSFLKNVRRCVLWSSGVGVFFTLRAIGLHDPLYILLLLAVLVSLEYAVSKR